MKSLVELEDFIIAIPSAKRRLVLCAQPAALSVPSLTCVMFCKCSSCSWCKYLSSIKTDLLVLDLNMPGQDYSVTISEIQQNHPDVKILVFSGYFDNDLEKRLKKIGVDGYVTKNIHPSRVLDLLVDVVDGKKCFISDELAEKANLEKQVSDKFKDSFCKRLGISKREQEILILISKGMTSQTIGKALFISKYTVETHRKNILRKLDMNSSTELVKFAIKQGLV